MDLNSPSSLLILPRGTPTLSKQELVLVNALKGGEKEAT